MVSKLIPNELRRSEIRACGVKRAYFHKGDTLLVIHDVQRFTFQPLGTLSSAVDFEAAEVDPFFNQTCGLFPDFSHSLAGGIVNVIRSPSTSQIGLA